MARGRPRKTSLSPDEMIALGEEMIAWVEEKKPLHLSEWYTIEKMFLYSEWKTFIDRPEFTPYYEMALKLVGKQYLDKESKIRDSISQRWQRVYFKDLRDQEDQDHKDKLDREFEKEKRILEEAARLRNSHDEKAKTAFDLADKELSQTGMTD